MQSSPLDPLRRRVAAELQSAERTRTRRRIFEFGFIQIVALALLVAGILHFSQEAADTGFSSYFSLLTSDTATVSSHLSDFSALLLESLPVESLFLIALGLAGCFVAWRGLTNSKRPNSLNLWYKFW